MSGLKAVRFHKCGDPSVLRYEDVDRPRPAVGQVLLRVVATTSHPVDATMRAGTLREEFPLRLPYTPGYDVAGRVAEVGEGKG